jgi:hypothetical protein
MPVPNEFTDLQLAGYRYAGDGVCAKCRRPLQWFITPKNRRMPFSLVNDVMVGPDGELYPKPSLTKLEPHFAACAFAADFRRRKKKQ